MAEDARLCSGTGIHGTADRVMFAKEQPRDPEYRDDDNRDYISVWRFQEWKSFAQKYDMHLIRCDQGALGGGSQRRWG